MLRLAEPLLSSRVGGWAVVDSPPRRIASGGQHLSLLILAAAGLVAMLAVVFDVRIASEAQIRSAALFEDAIVRASLLTDRTQPRPSIEAPEPVTSATRTTTAATAAAETGVSPSTLSSTATGVRSTAAADRGEAVQTAGAASSSAVSGSSDAADTTSAAAGDPASRIREYLGLSAGAQLPVSFGYEVQVGDTASSIARRFGLEEATVLFNNFDIYDPDHLTVGQILQLPPVDGLVYTVQPGDTLSRLEENYQADFEATIAFTSNGISTPEQIQVGQKLLLVQGSASLPAGATASATSTGSSGQSAQVWAVPTFAWPLGPDGISDPFGTPRANAFGYHTGVDFLAPRGTIVGATAGGQVTVATWDPSYGNWVEINHGGGYRSRYAHLDEIWVREGEWVQSNAYIGTVGNTGNSSGAHLHFEIIIDGQAVNPLAWLN